MNANVLAIEKIFGNDIWHSKDSYFSYYVIYEKMIRIFNLNDTPIYLYDHGDCIKLSFDEAITMISKHKKLNNFQ